MDTNKKKTNKKNGSTKSTKKDTSIKKTSVSKNKTVSSTKKSVVKKLEVNEVEDKEVVENKAEDIDNKNKNTEMIRMIGVCAALVVLVGLTFVVGLTAKKDKYTYQTHVGIKETSVADYLKIISKNDTSIIYIGRPGCGYCQMFQPILEEVLKQYKIGVEYVNIENISSQEEWDSFENSNEYLKAGEWGTPTLIVYKDKKIVKVNPGYVEKDNLIAFFKESGIIKAE